MNIDDSNIDSYLINSIKNPILRETCTEALNNSSSANNNNNMNNNNNNNNEVEILIEGQAEYDKALNDLAERRTVYSKRQRENVIEIVEKCSSFLEGKYLNEAKDWDPLDQKNLEETVKNAIKDINGKPGFGRLRWTQVFIYYGTFTTLLSGV